ILLQFNIFIILFIFFLFCFICVMLFFFFFSSRRRHTRSKRDWSSDVCSSDLTAGIYFLFGYQGSKNFVYVGEAEDVYRRLTQHTPERDKFIWDTAVVFIATGYGVLDKAKIKYLENRLYSIIKSENYYILLKKNKPN